MPDIRLITYSYTSYKSIKLEYHKIYILLFVSFLFHNDIYIYIYIYIIVA